MSEGDRARILVVEDDDAIRYSVEAVLSDEGFSVKVASDGQMALALARAWQPHVIVLDLVMPRMNGWTFAETYRSLPIAHAPIIAVTAAAEGAAKAAAEIGAQEVLVKPFDLNYLLEVVAFLVQHREP